MRIQLWSYNYDPEPTGIGPVSTVWVKAMRDRGHEVEVVAAHPHYPTPAWGQARKPYREVRDGITVLRLPLRIGRTSAKERLAQELSFTSALAAAAPVLPRPDVAVVVSPSFPALAPAIANMSMRRIPWVLWLQDILPDGAVTTSILKPGKLLRTARAFEQFAYRVASRIVVISESFERNLMSKGVPPSKLHKIYNPFTRREHDFLSLAAVRREPRVLCMGNIGHSQGLADVVRSWEAGPLDPSTAQLIIVGAGVAAADVAAEIRTERVQMLGLLSNEDLELELRRASVGLVTQRSDVVEFNVPSKLMNFMAYGLPVVASVRIGSEVEQIVRRADCGWAVDSRDPSTISTVIGNAVRDTATLETKGQNGRRFAGANFDPAAVAEKWDDVLAQTLGRAERLAHAPDQTLSAIR